MSFVLPYCFGMDKKTMKAKDLRLGNILEFEGRACKVLEIDSQGVVVLFDDGEEVWIDLFQFNSILLTEEWLLKVGFERFPKSFSVLNKKVNEHTAIIGDLKGFEMTSIIRGSVNLVPLPKIEYVHQLQNLYFALTGSELEIIT
jgi:hypothetical protein